MFKRWRAGLIGLAVALVGLSAAGVATLGSASADTPMYYVAMGDSLAYGVGADMQSNNFVYQIHQRELANYPGLQVMNFACTPAQPPGESAHTMLNGPYVCSGPNDDRSGPPLPSQLAAVETFLQQHVGQVAFLTIEIGAHDRGGNTALKNDINAILSRLKAADPGIRIFGANYHTPNLANWLTGPSGRLQARQAAAQAKPFNAFLASIYAAAGVPLADIPAAFDSDNFALTGTWKGTKVPQNVANLCSLAHTCQGSFDPHLNNAGQIVFADAFTRLIDNYSGTPTAATAKPQDRSAVVSWKAPKPTNGPPLNGYVVTPYLVSNNMLLAQSPRTFANTKTSQTVSSLTNGKTYLFKVAAKNPTGVGPSSAATPTIKIGKVAPPKNSCSSLTGTGTFNPGLPASSSKVKSSLSLSGSLGGCTGGGVKSGHIAFTSAKGPATNCQLLPTSYGPSSKGAVGTETITWNTGKTSTVTLTVKLNSTGGTNVTGAVTAGLFKGSHQTGQFTSTSSSDSCVSKPLTKFTFTQIATSIFK